MTYLCSNDLQQPKDRPATVDCIPVGQGDLVPQGHTPKQRLFQCTLTLLGAHEDEGQISQAAKADVAIGLSATMRQEGGQEAMFLAHELSASSNNQNLPQPAYGGRQRAVGEPVSSQPHRHSSRIAGPARWHASRGSLPSGFSPQPSMLQATTSQTAHGHKMAVQVRFCGAAGTPSLGLRYVGAFELKAGWAIQHTMLSFRAVKQVQLPTQSVLPGRSKRTLSMQNRSHRTRSGLRLSRINWGSEALQTAKWSKIQHASRLCRLPTKEGNTCRQAQEMFMRLTWGPDLAQYLGIHQ